MSNVIDFEEKKRKGRTGIDWNDENWEAKVEEELSHIEDGLTSEEIEELNRLRKRTEDLIAKNTTEVEFANLSEEEVRRAKNKLRAAQAGIKAVK